MTHIVKLDKLFAKYVQTKYKKKNSVEREKIPTKRNPNPRNRALVVHSFAVAVWERFKQGNRFIFKTTFQTQKKIGWTEGHIKIIAADLAVIKRRKTPDHQSKKWGMCPHLGNRGGSCAIYIAREDCACAKDNNWPLLNLGQVRRLTSWFFIAVPAT